MGRSPLQEVYRINTRTTLDIIRLHKFFLNKKVKLSLCLVNSALCHEGILGSGGIAPQFLTSALDAEWSASRPDCFTPGERAPGTHWIGGWVDPRAGFDAVEKTKILHSREWNPGRPARRITDLAIPTPLFFPTWRFGIWICFHHQLQGMKGYCPAGVITDSWSQSSDRLDRARFDH
jgi:hypothetical protein